MSVFMHMSKCLVNDKRKRLIMKWSMIKDVKHR